MKLKDVVGPLAITSVCTKLHSMLPTLNYIPPSKKPISRVNNLALLKLVQYRTLLFLKLSDPTRFGPAALKLLTKFEKEKPQHIRRPTPRDQGALLMSSPQEWQKKWGMPIWVL